MVSGQIISDTELEAVARDLARGKWESAVSILAGIIGTAIGGPAVGGSLSGATALLLAKLTAASATARLKQADAATEQERQDALVRGLSDRLAQLQQIGSEQLTGLGQRLDGLEEAEQERFEQTARLLVGRLDELQEVIEALAAGGGKQAPGHLAITAVRVDQKPRDHAIVDFWVKNGGGSDVVVLGVGFEVLETGRCELIKGRLHASATYDLDIAELKKPGDSAFCETSQLIEPGKADRFAVKLIASELGSGVFGAWRLHPTLETDAGPVAADPIEVWLPYREDDIEFDDMVELDVIWTLSTELTKARKGRDGERVVELVTEAFRQHRDDERVFDVLTDIARYRYVTSQVGRDLLPTYQQYAQQADSAEHAGLAYMACAEVHAGLGEVGLAVSSITAALRTNPGDDSPLELLLDLIWDGASSLPEFTDCIQVMVDQCSAGQLESFYVQQLRDALAQQPASSSTEAATALLQQVD